NFKHGAVYRSGAGVAAGVCAGADQMANPRAVCFDCGRIDGDSRVRAEFDCTANCGEKSAIERGGDYDRTAVLGMGMGRNGIGAGDPDYGDAACDLRSHGILEARGTVVERVSGSLISFPK